MANPPEIFILAGPNGAGKSTGAALVLPQRFQVNEFVNADVIQKSMGPGTSPITAGRVMLTRMRELRDAGESFAFETTLSAKTYVHFLKDAQNSGYFVHLAFISLAGPQVAKARVADRVAEGGHDIPPADIERRYHRGLKNFFELYQPLAHAWTLCDNTKRRLAIFAQGQGTKITTMHDQQRYDEIENEARHRP